MTSDAKILGANGCRHHPSPQLMASYVAGQLACAEAVAVATHIALCPDCAAVHHGVTSQSPSCTLESEAPAADVPAFSRCLVRAKMQQHCADKQAQRLDLPASVAPLLSKYAPCGARWWSIFPGIKRLRLKIRSPKQGDYSASLLRIKAGTKVPQHTHGDVEYMVVLQGTLVDENGTHPQGSFLTTRPGECHTPRATEDSDVLCLNLARGTICFTSKWLSWLNPFMKRECSAKTA